MDNYNEMYNIASSVYKLHEKMASLEIQGKINSLEYNKLLEYLEICLMYEDKLYKELDLAKLSEILIIINGDDSCIYDKLNVYRNHDCINNRIVNKLLCFNSFLAKENDKDVKEEYFKLLYTKIQILDTVHEEFIYYYLFILNEYICKCRSKDKKAKLINAKYRLSFMDVNIEDAMHTTNYRLDIPTIRCNFFPIDKISKNKDLYNYNKECLGEIIFNNEMINILNDDDDDVSLILHQCAMRASLLMIDDDSKLADLNDEFHKYLEDNGCNNKNEENIVKCFRKIKSDRENHFVNIR